MINLINTFIRAKNKTLKDLYLREAEEQDLRWAFNQEAATDMETNEYEIISIDSKGYIYPSDKPLEESKELTLFDFEVIETERFELLDSTIIEILQLLYKGETLYNHDGSISYSYKNYKFISADCFSVIGVLSSFDIPFYRRELTACDWVKIVASKFNGSYFTVKNRIYNRGKEKALFFDGDVCSEDFLRMARVALLANGELSFINYNSDGERK